MKCTRCNYRRAVHEIPGDDDSFLCCGCEIEVESTPVYYHNDCLVPYKEQGQGDR